MCLVSFSILPISQNSWVSLFRSWFLFLIIFLAQNKMNGPGMLAPVYFASLGLEKETCCLQTLYQSFRQLHLHPFCIHCSIKEKKVQSTAVFQSDLYSLTMKVFVFLQKKILHLCLLLSFICYSEQCLSHYSSPGMNTNIPGRNEDFATNLFNFILSAFLHQPLSLSDWWLCHWFYRQKFY